MSGNAAILAREGNEDMLVGVAYLQRIERKRLTAGLRARAVSLVEQINREAGQAMLYFNECAGIWFLYGRPQETAVDKLLLYGASDVEGFARLVARLESEVEA